MTIFKAIRTALGKAFLGDTLLAKALPLSDPAIFDDRLISLLQGLNLLQDPFNYVYAIRGSDIRAVFNEMAQDSNPDRIAFISSLKTFVSQFGTAVSVNHGAFAVDASSASAGDPPGSGVGISSDGGGSTIFRLTRLGPKSWHVFIEMGFDLAGPIGTFRTAWWKLTVPEALVEGSLFKTFFDSLPDSEPYAIPFVELDGRDYNAPFNRALSIFRGSGVSADDAIQIKDVSHSIGWSTTASSSAKQLGRTFSAVVVVP